LNLELIVCGTTNDYVIFDKYPLFMKVFSVSFNSAF